MGGKNCSLSKGLAEAQEKFKEREKSLSKRLDDLIARWEGERPFLTTSGMLNNGELEMFENCLAAIKKVRDG